MLVKWNSSERSVCNRIHSTYEKCMKGQPNRKMWRGLTCLSPSKISNLFVNLISGTRKQRDKVHDKNLSLCSSMIYYTIFYIKYKSSKIKIVFHPQNRIRQKIVQYHKSLLYVVTSGVVLFCLVILYPTFTF